MLLASVSAFVLGGALPTYANTANWGAVRTPDIIAPEPAKRAKKTKLARIRSTDAPIAPVAETSAPEFTLAEDTFAAAKKLKSERSKAAKRSKSSKKKSLEAKSDKIPSTVPAGPLHVIVSVDEQRASLYANGTFVASTKVSTGTKTHPTPMGVFSVIQKNRHHISNLYHAPMPYMQRLTWSGTAMHTGALPGYPASHGCIRLTNEFAAMLWKATKIGARVIVTREDVKPVEFAHARLFPALPAVAALPPTPDKPSETTGTLVRTADASNAVSGAVVQDAERPADAPAPVQPELTVEPATPPAPSQAEVTAEPVASPAPVTVTDTAAETPNAEPPIDPRVRMVEATASSQEIERRSSPVSVFISRKDGKLYVRQAMQPLFELPLTLRNPDQPVGTHVYTAMEIKNGAMRWTAVTVPSTFSREKADADKASKGSKKSQPEKVPHMAGQKLSPSAALDRIDMPQEALERLAGMLIPGSSLIVSDNSIVGETGRYTDFIVLTR